MKFVQIHTGWFLQLKACIIHQDVIANADGQVIIGEVNQDATGQNIQQRGGGFIDKIVELIQADGKTVAVKGNESSM